MNFKKYIILGGMASGLMLNTSCSDEFTEKLPTAEVSEVSIFSTSTSLYGAINGMHRNMYSRQMETQVFNGFPGQMFISDGMGEDLVFINTNSGIANQTIWTHTNNESSTVNAYFWQFWYSMIKNANYIITKGPAVPAATADELKQKNVAIAEAYAYRAFGLFQLVQTFAKTYNSSTASTDLGVVIRLDPDDNGPAPRSTVQEVYDQINEDLNEGLNIMGSYNVANASHLSSNVIKGLQARVALVQKKYDVAANKANEARSGGILMSNAQYKAGFNDYTNPEWMWGSHVVADQSNYFGNYMAYMSRNYNSTVIRVCPRVVNLKLYDFLSANDVRKAVIDASGNHTSLNLPSTFAKAPYTSQKFLAESTSVSLGDAPYMRIAEMYLIEAEALYNLGNEAGSKIVLQQYLDNRTANSYTISSSGVDYYQEILMNRRAEFWGEGFRFYDLKRLGQELNRTPANVPNVYPAAIAGGPAIILPSDPKWQWLIPRQEINANPLMVQNPVE